MQSWKTKTIPKHWKTGQESIQLHLVSKGWKHVFMTDQDNDQFVQTYFPDFWSTYAHLKYPVQKADTMRYMWLYVNGGVYMDMDYVVNKPLDPLFQDIDADIYLAQSSNGYSLSNSFMASKPRNQFWLKCLDQIKHHQPAWYNTKHFYILTSTGPLMLQRVFNQWKRANVALIPTDLINPCPICNLTCSRHGYLRPLKGQTWNSFDTHIINYVFCYPGKAIFIVFFLFMLLPIVMVKVV